MVINGDGSHEKVRSNLEMLWLRNWKVVVYILAGFSFFLIQGINVYTVIAGIVGALCALLFYGGTILSHQNRLFKYGFSFVIPLAIMILSTIDFTEKKGWQETRTDSTYEASFGYFNGKHEIPIEVERGETLTFSVSVMNKNGGGHGYHIRTDGHPRVPMLKHIWCNFMDNQNP